MPTPQDIGLDQGAERIPEPEAGSQGVTAPPSRSEAVRRALAAGFEGAHEGVEYIRKAFAIEIAPSFFLAVKATEKKKGWAKGGKPGRKPKKAAEAGRPATPGESQAGEDNDLMG